MQLDQGAINRRVLVVDDNSGIHEDFRRILCSTGGMGVTSSSAFDALEAQLLERRPPARPRIEFHVESAMQGEAGWQRVKEAREKGEPFALAFVDMRMPPGWDGIETIEHMWADDPELQIAICTAYSDYSWSEALDRLGWVDQVLILKKPFDPIEARQIACSLTHKWSLASLAATLAPELDARS